MLDFLFKSNSTLETSRRIWKTALLPIIDYLMVFIGSLLVYQIRYNWFDNSFSVGNSGDLPFIYYLIYSALYTVIIILIFAFQGSYNLTQRPFWKDIPQLILGIFFGLLLLIVFLFFNEYNREALPNGVPVSRFILAVGGFFASMLVILGRIFLELLENILYRSGIGRIKVAYIGAEKSDLLKWLDGRQDIEKVYHFHQLNESSFADIEKLITSRKISELYIYSYWNPLERKLSHLASIYKIEFVFYPAVFENFSAHGMKPIQIENKVYLQVTHTNLEGWWVVVKRLIDIIFSGTALILLSPLFLIIAAAIKLDSQGSIFYLSERVNPQGKVFKIWKFRRLKKEFCTSESDPKSQKALEFEQELIAKNNIKKDSVLYKIKDDPRMTRVGKFLERTSLDELPQFINSFIGSMSVVGPRPHQPREVAKYGEHHFKVLNIKPGITGLAQINGRSDLSFEQEVMIDTYYLENWSIFLDIWVIIKTPLIILFNRHKG